MPLREQFRQIFGTLWRVLKPNPLRTYVLIYWRIFGMDDTDRARFARWIEDAERDSAARDYGPGVARGGAGQGRPSR